MNLDKLKEQARRFEQKEDWRRAIEIYLKAIQGLGSGTETVDPSLYNKVGDLQMKAGDSGAALRAYEQAAELYADQGFFNNAIALCGKILRVNPGRTETYLRLAHLHARKNVIPESKRNLLEYIERMHGVGQLEEAFDAVKAFADNFSGNQDIRLMLSELLRAASRTEEAKEQLEKLAGDLEARGEVAGAQQARERMDELDEDEEGRERPSGSELIFLDTGMGDPYPGPDWRVGEGSSGIVDLDPAQAGDGGVGVEGIDVETNAAHEVQLGLGADQDGSRPDETAEDSNLQAYGSLLLDEEGEKVSEFEEEALSESSEEHSVEIITDASFSPEDITIVSGVELDSMPEFELPSVDETPEPGAGEVPVEYSVEANDLDLPEVGEIDDVGGTLDLGEMEEDLPEPAPEAKATEAEQWPPEVVPVPGAEDALFDSLEGESLTLPVLDRSDPAAVRREAFRLLDEGNRHGGIELLEDLVRLHELGARWEDALQVSADLLRLDPDDIGRYQKRVELAYHSGDHVLLVRAYLALADALVRAGAVESALSVYQRVEEHDPGNAVAMAAIATLGPRPTNEDAAPIPCSTPRTDESFVDLGALVLEETPERDTRMRVEAEDPSGDEDQDFLETLNQFKRGIEENLGSEDYQAHYDLGIAFKEMGLLDEAIAQFQKALRAPEDRLKASEALGICFYEKGRSAIAEAVLRRSIEAITGSDDEKIGLIYWLGRALEGQGKIDEAVRWYERALAVDIQFLDLSERIGTLGRPG